jgi:hypothetical protein
MFGKDMNKLMIDEIYYFNDKNVNEKITIPEFFLQILKDLADEYTNPITTSVPFIFGNNPINPFKRNIKNMKAFRNKFREILDSREDTESMYFHFRKSG